MPWEMIFYIQLLSVHVLTFGGIKTKGGGGTGPPVPPHATALLLIHIASTLLLLEWKYLIIFSRWGASYG